MRIYEPALWLIPPSLALTVTPAQILGPQHATMTRAACDSSWLWSLELLVVKSEDGTPEVTLPCVVTATNRWPKLLEHPHVMHSPRSRIVVQCLGMVKDNIKSCWPPGWGERKGAHCPKLECVATACGAGLQK